MTRRYLRVLAVLAVATLGTVMANSCTIGSPPDNPDCLFLCDKAIEKSQTLHGSYASLPLSQAVQAKLA